MDREAALLAALLSERDPFTRNPRGTGPRRASRSDLLDRLDALETFESRSWEAEGLNVGAARFVLRARDQLFEIARRELGPAPSPSQGDAPLLRALLTAYPDRLARRREPRSPRGVMVGGRGVRLAEESAVLEDDLFLCIDLDAGRDQAHDPQLGEGQADPAGCFLDGPQPVWLEIVSTMPMSASRGGATGNSP